MKLVLVETEDGSPATPEQYAELGKIRRWMEGFFDDERKPEKYFSEPPATRCSLPTEVAEVVPGKPRHKRKSASVGPSLPGLRPEDEYSG